MVVDDRKQADWKQTLFYIVAWLVSVCLMMVDLVFVREIVMRIMTSVGLVKAAVNPEAWPLARLTFGWIRGVVDQSMLLILACVGVALTIAIEYYYRKGMHQGLLVKRVTRVVSIELIVGVVSWIITIFFKWILMRVTA